MEKHSGLFFSLPAIGRETKKFIWDPDDMTVSVFFVVVVFLQYFMSILQVKHISRVLFVCMLYENYLQCK